MQANGCNVPVAVPDTSLQLFCEGCFKATRSGFLKTTTNQARK